MSDQRGGIIFRLLSLLALFAVFAGLYVIRHPLMRFAGEYWVVSDPLEHADAIVVIGDDNFAGDRASRAAALYRSGWAPKVVASGRKLRPYAGVAELIEKDLVNRGVPADAIIRFDHNGENTREEAEALRGLIAQQGWHRIILVTSNYHTRRARYIFRKVLPASVALVVTPAQDLDFDPNSWWTTRKGTELFLHEIGGYSLSMWELRGT